MYLGVVSERRDDQAVHEWVISWSYRCSVSHSRTLDSTGRRNLLSTASYLTVDYRSYGRDLYALASGKTRRILDSKAVSLGKITDTS